MICTPVDPKCERCGHAKFDHIYRDSNSDILLCPNVPNGDSFRRPVADMPRIGVAPFPDVPLGIWRHHKGGLYSVIGGALRADLEVDTVEVLYMSCEHGYVASRTHDDFVGAIGADPRGGSIITRFSPTFHMPT